MIFVNNKNFDNIEKKASQKKTKYEDVMRMDRTIRTFINIIDEINVASSIYDVIGELSQYTREADFAVEANTNAEIIEEFLKTIGISRTVIEDLFDNEKEIGLEALELIQSKINELVGDRPMNDLIREYVMETTGKEFFFDSVENNNFNFQKISGVAKKRNFEFKNDSVKNRKPLYV